MGGRSVSLKGCNFEPPELSNHFESFNDESKDANMMSQKSKLMCVNQQLNLCPSKSTIPVLKRILFRYL